MADVGKRPPPPLDPGLSMYGTESILLYFSEEAVKIENGVFNWEREGGGARPTLDDINLNVTPGQLVAVVGQVGSGKSSLLSAILGEMEKIRGNVSTKVRMAY